VLGPGTLYEQPYETASIIPSGPKAGEIFDAGGASNWLAAPFKANPIPSRKLTELYNPVTNAFEPGPQMNTARFGATASVLPSGPNAGKILLVGGFADQADPKNSIAIVPLTSTELYDPASNTFASPARTPTLITARGFHTTTVITSGPKAGWLLIAGGQADDRTSLASSELYDPKADRFIGGPLMLAPRTGHVAMNILSGPQAGKILIAGGWVDDPDNAPVCVSSHSCFYTNIASTELYDPIANRFIRGPRMHGAPGAAVAVQLPPGGAAAPTVISRRARLALRDRHRNLEAQRLGHLAHIVVALLELDRVE